jgi:hypothetical protein
MTVVRLRIEPASSLLEGCGFTSIAGFAFAREQEGENGEGTNFISIILDDQIAKLDSFVFFSESEVSTNVSYIFCKLI